MHVTETDFPLGFCEENTADVEEEEVVEEEEEENIRVVVLAIVAARRIVAHLCLPQTPAKDISLTSVQSSNISSFLLELYIRTAEKDAVDDRAAESGNCGLDYRVN